MKFVIFNGSPSGKNSATNKIGEAFLSGAARAGADVENIFLAEKNIAYCQGCFSCWFKTPGKCVIQDDMQDLLETYMAADVVGLATPVFTWDMTANLKTFVDRLVPLKSPLVIQQNHNFDLADAKVKSQKFVVLSNCGFPGSNNFETLKMVMAACNPILEIYRNCGKLIKSTDSSVQQIVQSYLKIVEEAGYEMAATGEVSAATRGNLNMELMSVQEYVKYIGMDAN